MSETRGESPGDAQPSLALRLGGCHLTARSDLTVSRHVFRGEATYIIRDPLTFGTHRLDYGDYALFLRIERSRSLGKIFEEAVADRLLEREDEDRFYDFILSLHRRGFLQFPGSEAQLLYERRRRREEARASGRWKSAIFFRLRLFNPDGFLNRTAGRVRPLFSRTAVLVWLLVVAAGLAVAVRNAKALAQPLSQVLVADNLPLLMATLVVLKIVHELAHAYSCKILGGTVPEMGVNVIAGTPLPYVDASDAWKFPRKRDRVLVSVAGVYVELFLAAIAVLVWNATEPGIVRAVAYNAALLASVVTIGFNLNPLMKFDGYFVLSDLIEVPNLRERSTSHALSVLKRCIFGIQEKPMEEGRYRRSCFFWFGIACALYRPFVTLGISVMIASTYFALGVVVAAVYLSTELGGVVARLWRFLKKEEIASMRVRATLVGSSAFVLLPMGICLVPLPDRVVVPGVVSTFDETTLRAEAPGFVSVLFARTSDEVEKDAPLVSLAHFRDDVALYEARGRLEQALLHAEALSYQDWITAQLERKRAEHVAREVAWYERENERRQVRSPRNGRLVDFPVEGELGRYVHAGGPLAVLASGPPVARLMLTEGELATADPIVGGRASFRPVACPDRVIEGRIASVQPRGSRRIEGSQHSHLAGGSIPVDLLTQEALQPYFEVVIEFSESEAGDLPRGARGFALLGGNRKSLLQSGIRRVLRFVQELKRND